MNVVLDGGHLMITIIDPRQFRGVHLQLGTQAGHMPEEHMAKLTVDQYLAAAAA